MYYFKAQRYIFFQKSLSCAENLKVKKFHTSCNVLAFFCIYIVRSRKYGLLLFIHLKSFKHEKIDFIRFSSKHDML